jgi:two-component system sensor histidine kinase PilS (NtrC family)
MRNNAQRVSAIIENVLRLSRREAPRPERIALADWCARFREEYCATTQYDPASFRLQVTTPDLDTTIDARALHQILWNLCENAFKHGGTDGSAPGVELMIARVARYGRVCLEVADRGPGVALHDVDRIFEPFFTRGTQGTGLGLFLARELAEINGATLLYEARRGGGSIFRLVFADPSRWASAMVPGDPAL